MRTEIYSDEYIDRWGRIFCAHRLDRVLGITFEKFLGLPSYWMRCYHALLNSSDHLDAAAVRVSRGEYEAPTVAQAKVAEKVYCDEVKAAIRRTSQGLSTTDDAELLEACIAAARGIRELPRQDNGVACEHMRHHRHPKSNAMFDPEVHS
jgi:hypothetical protein